MTSLASAEQVAAGNIQLADDYQFSAFPSFSGALTLRCGWLSAARRWVVRSLLVLLLGIAAAVLGKGDVPAGIGAAEHSVGLALQIGVKQDGSA
ncbi:hypothetical protein NCCP436_16230 [Pseudomonas sp. NCCP-436]|nr:hypothetical protein NCCP436_16230 [Pseudomonas sp. NCCP-436]